MPVWTTVELVADALGPGIGPAFAADPYSTRVVAAANAAAYRKRVAGGYVDDPADTAPAPAADVEVGTTTWAVALWRDRASTDGHASFEELAAYTPTGATWGTIKRLLGIGRAQVDAAVSVAEVTAARRRVLGRGWL